MNKVYIVCEPTVRKDGGVVPAVDLTPAAAWGEPVILLATQQTFINPMSTIEELHRKLETFSDDDFLVPIGDPALMCAASMVASERNNGRVKVLKWDRKLGAYFPVQIDVRKD